MDYYSVFHPTLAVLLHYLAKLKQIKTMDKLLLTPSKLMFYLKLCKTEQHLENKSYRISP